MLLPYVKAAVVHLNKYVVLPIFYESRDIVNHHVEWPLEFSEIGSSRVHMHVIQTPHVR